jgi:membrane protein implicated in regulation of membrane protease activity
MEWVWLSVFIITLIVEIISVELVSIWFSAASLISLILALCGVSVTLQIVVFLVVSIVLLASLRTICMKFLKNSKEKTNLDSLVGTVHTLVKEIKDECPGEIKINGVIWRVVSKNQKAISVGEKVKIVEIDGNKFIVEKGE